MPTTYGKWALLIGIDCYIPGDKRPTRYRNLNGCVSDVEAVQKYLNDIGVQNITVLTSSKGPESDRPIEEGTPKLPIYGNIERELNYIIDKASAGDLVYIHYSGHGIRRRVLGPDQRSTGDEINGTALALADVMDGGAYLTGHRLGEFAKGMVKKGLRLTLVLDSCFSGQGFRIPTTASATNYIFRTADNGLDESILESDKLVEVEAAKMDQSIGKSVHRNAVAEPCWLANPTGCTVLTACNFDESAREEALPGTASMHGVFTFYMLEILNRTLSGRRPTHAGVRSYVKSKITSPRKQSPVLHGDGDYVFFGKERVVERPISRILGQDGDPQVDLDVGYAQGVVEGALYNVYRENQLPGRGTVPSFKAVVVEALTTSPFRSVAILFSNNADAAGRTYEDPETDAKGESKGMSGDSAVLSSWAVPHTVVRMSHTAQRISEAQVATLREELDAHHYEEFDLLSHENETELNPTFAIDLDEDEIFQVYILDSASEQWNRAQRIPSISATNSNWAKDLIYVLRHSSRFRAIKDIRNEVTRTILSPSCLEVAVISMGIRVPRGPDGNYRMTHGAVVRFTFALSTEYISSRGKNLFVSFYMFNATWGISKLHPAPGQPALLLSHGRQERFVLKMEVPPPRNSKDPNEIEDIIRVFVCNTDKSWEGITLPNLPAEALITPLEAETEILEATHAKNGGEGAVAYRNRALRSPGEEDEDEWEEKWGIVDIVLRTTSV
ncbi:hypothetical protein TWF718_000441 [Orbilia javanica]|uniref:Peptidase C14 caspase domain-containing protein n=1 Tax=Orbilia javanica TaxID=47235 RepID=A0AAN8RLZ5_9PEZI